MKSGPADSQDFRSSLFVPLHLIQDRSNVAPFDLLKTQQWFFRLGGFE
jgi:hypothetical protein